jgi:subtilisin family serine protease
VAPRVIGPGFSVLMAGILLLAAAPGSPAVDPLQGNLPGLDPTRVVAMFRTGIPDDLELVAAEHGARVAAMMPALHGAVLAARDAALGRELLAALELREDVVAVQLDFDLHLHAKPNDERYASQWAPAASKLPDAWERGWGSHAVRLAILDTGAALSHEDLAANICATTNVASPGASALDDYDHGSHTAGIAAGVANNGVGIAGASQSCLLIGKVCDANGDCPVSWVAQGIDWAVGQDAGIISMSLGSVFHASVLQQAMKRAWQEGVLLVASAGNSDCGLVDFPAAYDEVVAVAALQNTAPLVTSAAGRVNGQREIRAPYSNCGPEVELAAPGESIYSTFRHGYGIMSGTSMAAPLVAGLAALVMAANPVLTNAQVRCVLDATAADYGAPGRDVEYGFGAVRAGAAVAAAATGASCQQPHSPLGLWDESP